MTSWQYDVQGRPIAKQYPDGSKITYAYDSATGRLKSAVDESGQHLAYDYYLDGNVHSISYPDAQVPTPTVSFVYDTIYDRMVSMQDGIGTTAWTYYAPGNPGALQVSTHTGPFANLKLTYSYDVLGRMLQQDVSGTAQTYAYDSMGRVTNIVNALGAFVYGYDGATRRLQDVVYPNGQKTHYDYFNNAGSRRTQKITHTRPDTALISRFSYAYDPVGNITNWVQELGTVTNVWNVGYDAAQQLKSVAIAQSGGTAVTYAFDYDAAGNRLFEESNGVRRAFNYNSLNQLVSSSEPSNQVSYAWDGQNRLRSVTRGASISEFTYDGSGRLASIAEKTNSTLLRQAAFVWSGADIIEKRDKGTGAVLERIFDEGVQIANAGAGLPAGNYYMLRDHLGSVRQLIDAAGAVRAAYNYAPFGQRAKLAGDLDIDLGFAGQYYHQATALGLTWYRAYDARAGRWLSRDPLGEWDGPNVYAYTQNNPLNRIDPLGLQACPVQNNTAPLKMMGKQMGKDVEQAQKVADTTTKVAKHVDDIAQQVLKGNAEKALETATEGIGKEALKGAQKKFGAYNEQVEIMKDIQKTAEKEIPWYEKAWRSAADGINCALKGGCPQQSPTPDPNPPQDSPSLKRPLNKFQPQNQPTFKPGPPPPPFKPGPLPPTSNY
jgi:RHS repeat-associated protein